MCGSRKTPDRPDFNPRAPRGARHIVAWRHSAEFVFQSTRSARSATLFDCRIGWERLISIHALREERDRIDPLHKHARCTISIHALREERDHLFCLN